MHTRTMQGLGVAILAPLVVFALRYSLQGALGEQSALLPFLVAVIAAAWWGGAGPGALATAIGTLLGLYFFVPPERSFEIVAPAYLFSAALFVSIGLAISYLFEALHKAHLREREEQFHVLADSIPQLVWMARPDGYRFWFNARWYDYTGLLPSESVNQGWLQAHDKQDVPQVVQSWQGALASGRPWEDLARLRCHDGTLRWHLSRAIPVRDANGTIMCWFGTSTDVTERIEAEQVLQDADRRKDEFLAILAHELRNPLAAMTSAMDALKRVPDDAEACLSLRDVIARQLGHIQHLTEDLLDLSRVRQGKLNLQFEKTDLIQAVEQAAEVIRPQIERREHQLSIEAPSSPIYVNGDPTRLIQVFVNLLGNAAKFTDQHGRIAVVIATGEGQATISVCDNGAGIPAHMLKEIFDLFRQGQIAGSKSLGGLGIGLTLVKQLVELHGGSIDAKSAGPGQGSEFVVKLPSLEMPVAVGSAGHLRKRTSFESSPHR